MTNYCIEEKKEGADDPDAEEEEDVEFLGKAPKRKDTRITFYRKLIKSNLTSYRPTFGQTE